MKRMTVQQLTAILQNYCHEGHALDEVEIYDREGNKVFEVEDVELQKDHENEVCMITIK